MQMRSLESIKPKQKLARITAAVVYLACSAAIVGCSLPDVGAALHGTKLATALTGTAIRDTADADSSRTYMIGKTRNKANCAECGVIESMRRIDKREEIVGWCGVDDSAGSPFSANLIDGGQRLDSVTLADTVADVVAGDRGAQKTRVTTRHQIVVRFRDGSRHVFNEETPRTVRVGDRIQVIAGAARPNG